MKYRKSERCNYKYAAIVIVNWFMHSYASEAEKPIVMHDISEVIHRIQNDLPKDLQSVVSEHAGPLRYQSRFWQQTSSSLKLPIVFLQRINSKVSLRNTKVKKISGDGARVLLVSKDGKTIFVVTIEKYLKEILDEGKKK